jgi:branched-chain amino acid transport system ATP-binding protein
MTALRSYGLQAGYTAAVVRDVDLSLSPGEITVLLGANGAGKTTLLLTLSGLLPRLGGEVEVDGIQLARVNARSVSRAGVLLVPDDRALFPTLTVHEHLLLADKRGADEAITWFPALARRLRVVAGALSGGEQQMLTLARALLQRPKVLMVDELSLGLAPMVVEDLLATLQRLTDETNAAVLLVEQHVRLALGAADQAIVLAHGEVVLQGPAAELSADSERLEAAYLGAGSAVA